MFRYAQHRKSSPRFHPKNFIRNIQRIDKATLVKNIFLLGVVFSLLGGLILFALFAWYSRDLPNPDVLITRDIAQATKMYDRTGTHLLYEIYGEENRTVVKMQEGFCKDDAAFATDTQGIPLFVAQAVITAEDRTFCTHHGFSIKGLLRAIIFRGSRGGGSTLTQQLVKNAILSNERHGLAGLSRKIKELLISIALEKKYSKDEILQIYFNEIPYGSTYYGIQSAAQNFYEKNVNELSLAEAATLAGLPQLPTYYINNPDDLRERRDWILSSMADQGYITREAAQAAQKEETPLHIRTRGEMVAPHFIMWVKGMLESLFGTSMVETGGLRVITTLDYDKQLLAEQAVKTGVETHGPLYDFHNAGLLAENPRTGEILSMVGSPDFSDDAIDGQVNATLQPLQPGSSIKPIVYAAAFEKGYTPNTLLWDVQTTFPTETDPYTPYNYDLKEHGIVSLRTALQGSLNIPAVKTLALVGIDQAIAFAQRLGYTTLSDRSRIGLSMVLGGAEVTMIDHVNAYSVFANNGVLRSPQALLHVEDADGNELYAFDAEKAPHEQVLDPKITALTSNVLSDNTARAYVFGPNNFLTLPDRPVAAKTGTTNNYKDAWTVGYTPSLVAGVWVGNASGATMKTGADGSKIAAPIWNEFMKGALKETPVEAFPEVVLEPTGKAILDGTLETTTVTIDRASGKLATDRTPASFKETVSCGQFHTILTYINPEDPLGPLPEHPEEHPQYAAWENGIITYIANHNAHLEPGESPLETCTPPTEEDDVHTKKNEPSITITSPEKNDHIGRTFALRYENEVKRSFGRIDVSLDGSFIGSSVSFSETTLTLPSWVHAGEHTLEVTVYDDVDNSARDHVSLVVDEGASSYSTFTITNPFPSQTITRSPELASYPIVIEIPSSVPLATLTLFSTHLASNTEEIIASSISPSAIVSIPWILPSSPGSYSISARGTQDDGTVIDAKNVLVNIQ